jgi:Flp pilus assembly pilin Flp
VRGKLPGCFTTERGSPLVQVIALSLLWGIAESALSTDDESMRRPDAWRNEEGQTMAEYGVILAVITPAIVAAIALLAFTLAGEFQAVADFFS